MFVLNFSDIQIHRIMTYDDCNYLKPIFHWQLGLHWQPNANEINIKDMACTWATPASCIGDPTPPILHLLTLGVGVGGNATFSVCVGSNTNFSIFRYQHVGIPNAKLWRLGSKSMPGPNVNGFVSQWNIGVKVRPTILYNQ